MTDEEKKALKAQRDLLEKALKGLAAEIRREDELLNDLEKALLAELGADALLDEILNETPQETRKAVLLSIADSHRVEIPEDLEEEREFTAGGWPNLLPAPLENIRLYREARKQGFDPFFVELLHEYVIGQPATEATSRKMDVEYLFKIPLSGPFFENAIQPNCRNVGELLIALMRREGLEAALEKRWEITKVW